MVRKRLEIQIKTKTFFNRKKKNKIINYIFSLPMHMINRAVIERIDFAR